VAELRPEQLEEAFALFSQASAELTSAYEALQRRVEQLTGELAATNGELRVQLAAKDALSQRLAALLAALPGGVIVLDRARRITDTNPAANLLLGHAEAGAAWDDLAARTLRPTATPDEFEAHRAGEPAARRLRLSVSALPDGGSIALLNDVTAAHALTAQLERARRLSAMGEMAARLAHNLRTPLATALLYAGNLGRAAVPEAERSRFAEKTVDSLRRVERMIQDMLRFVRGYEDEFEPFAVGALLVELGQVIEPQMTRRGVSFDIDDRSNGQQILGNRKAVAGALLNLLENALQATDAGGRVRLIATAVGAAPGGGALAASTAPGTIDLSVRDSGAGIDPAVLERLFEPFFTTRSDGTGLGLAIVRGVATAHGGEALVDSRPGQGSVFTLRLPVSAGAVVAA
jgi:two-component system, sensor histidine kinase FlrB